MQRSRSSTPLLGGCLLLIPQWSAKSLLKSTKVPGKNQDEVCQFSVYRHHCWIIRTSSQIQVRVDKVLNTLSLLVHLIVPC